MREPSDDEVAGYLGISVDTYGRWLVDLGFTSIWSIDEKEYKAQLAGALGQFAEREQQVLYLYYQEELTLKEVAYIMNLSESQISRIHAKTILCLRRML